MRYLAAACAGVALLAVGCTTSPGSGSGGPGSGPTTGAGSQHVTLRLGYVADVTQAPALVGIGQGLFAASLGRGVTLRPVRFATAATEAAALAGGRLDAAYVSPDAILTVLRTPRVPVIKVISGASAAPPELVVTRRISAPSALRGRTLAIPATGGTADVMLRGWLAGKHLTASGRGGVAVTAIAQGSAAVAAFKAGTIAGAIEPAPWDLELTAAGGRLIAGGGRPASPPATANLVVTQRFLNAHGTAVFGLLKGQVQANDYLRANLLKSSQAISGALASAGQPLPTSVLALAMAQITFTDNPGAASLIAQVRRAAADGLPTPTVNAATLYDLAPLDLILRASGELPVSV